MTRKFAIIAALGVTALSGAAFAQADALTRDPIQVQSGSYVLDPAHGKITWSVDHMGFSTYVGQFTNVAANLDLNVKNPSASRLNATVKMDSVGTFSDGLDKHLKTADFFDTAKFPSASFRATGIRLVDRDTAKITGNLTLRGVTKSIEIQADFNQAGVNPVDPAARSRMNVPFTLHDNALDALFLQESEAAGLLALKGHKAVGGMRASLYNAVPMEAVEALVAFMRDFARRHG